MRAWLLLGMVLLVRLSVAGMADEVPTDAAKVVPLVEAASGETHHELPVPAVSVR
jgi:hypothetical protein